MQAGGQEFDPPHLHHRDKVRKRTKTLLMRQQFWKAEQTPSFGGLRSKLRSLTSKPELDRYEIALRQFHNGRIAQVVRAHA